MKTIKVIFSLILIALIFTEFVELSLPYMDTLDKHSLQGAATGISILLAHIFSAAAILYVGITRDFFDD